MTSQITPRPHAPRKVRIVRIANCLRPFAHTIEMFQVLSSGCLVKVDVGEGERKNWMRARLNER